MNKIGVYIIWLKYQFHNEIKMVYIMRQNKKFYMIASLFSWRCESYMI